MVSVGLDRAVQEATQGFNLLVADRDQAFLITGGADKIQCMGLSPGMHVLTNEHELNRIALDWEPPKEIGPPDQKVLIDSLAALLKRHDPITQDGFSPCKHHEDRGTRSSTIILMGGEGIRFLFADGPPCTTPFTDLSAMALELTAKAGKPRREAPRSG
jgi:hypothetical protein